MQIPLIRKRAILSAAEQVASLQCTHACKFVENIPFFGRTLRKAKTISNSQQDAQLSQRDRAAGCVTVFAKSRTPELGDNDLRTL